MKDAVGKYHDVPSIEFDNVGKIDFPIYNDAKTDRLRQPKVEIDSNYNPFNKGKSRRTAATSDWEELYNSLAATKEEDTQTSIFDDATPSPDTSFTDTDNESSHNGGKEHNAVALSNNEQTPSHFQYKGQFIITAVRSGLMLIDQHRAHKRVLYEEYLERMNNRRSNIQKVLFPEMIELSMSEKTVMENILPQLSLMGFDITPLGGASFAINGIPDGIEGINISNLIHDMINTASEHDGRTEDNTANLLAANLARHAAIPYGQVLSINEMSDLISRLFACSDVNHTPEGQTIMAIIPQENIEELF